MHCSLARVEELYWAGNYWKESFFRTDYDYDYDYDYEDYAPAFCVGYSGCAQVSRTDDRNVEAQDMCEP